MLKIMSVFQLVLVMTKDVFYKTAVSGVRPTGRKRRDFISWKYRNNGTTLKFYKGMIEAPGFYQNKALWCRCKWIGPGRGWIDPVKEAKAIEPFQYSNLALSFLFVLELFVRALLPNLSLGWHIHLQELKGQFLTVYRKFAQPEAARPSVAHGGAA
jgi:hypothetical protein